jgi:hypothetical protein
LALRLYKRNITTIIGSDDNTGTKIDNLYTTIEIKKELSGKPSEGTVKIFNLNDSTETRIKEKGKRIRVVAGYDGNDKTLYDGDIRRVERDKQSLDRVVSITLGGNVFKLTNAVFNKSYTGAVSVKQIVMDAVPSFDLSYIGIDIIPDAQLNDFSFTGRTADLLDKILRPLNVQWIEDNAFIKFSLKGQPITETVFVLKSGTGLVGSPSVTEKGIKAKSLLNGLLNIGDRVKIESKRLNGLYKITQLIHKGDNRDGEFLTEFLGIDSQ